MTPKTLKGWLRYLLKCAKIKSNYIKGETHMWSLRNLLGKGSMKLSFTAGLLVAAVGLMGSLGFGLAQVSAAGVDCDNNAMIKCGFTTPTDFINKAKANNSLN